MLSGSGDWVWTVEIEVSLFISSIEILHPGLTLSHFSWITISCVQCCRRLRGGCYHLSPARVIEDVCSCVASPSSIIVGRCVYTSTKLVVEKCFKRFCECGGGGGCSGLGEFKEDAEWYCVVSFSELQMWYDSRLLQAGE